jgi:hypothetical protein
MKQHIEGNNMAETNSIEQWNKLVCSQVYFIVQSALVLNKL